MTLRRKLIRLAYTNPELRSKLLPLFKESVYTPGMVDPGGWEPGTVQPLEFAPGMGSQMPPARDMKGDHLNMPGVGKAARLSDSILRMFKPNSFFHRFFSEKDIPYRVFEKTDRYGVSHTIPNTVVIEHIAQTRGREAQQIETILRRLDFNNGNVNHFLEHLAGAIANQYGGTLR